MLKGYRGETERDLEREKIQREIHSRQGYYLGTFWLSEKFILPLLRWVAMETEKKGGGKNQNLMEGLTWVFLKIAWKLDSSNYDLKGM